MIAPMIRCTHITDRVHRVRCTAIATHRLLNSDGWRVAGNIYCQKHAQAIVDEYRDGMGWEWAIQLLEEAL